MSPPAEAPAPFTLSTFIKTSADAVAKAWLTADGLCAWFLHDAAHLRIDGVARGRTEQFASGDIARWTWLPVFTEDNRVLVVEPARRFRMVFGKGAVLTVVWEAEGNHVLVTLRQEDHIDAEYRQGCITGWIFFLTNLKAYLEHGVDLREKDVAKIRRGSILNC